VIFARNNILLLTKGDISVRINKICMLFPMLVFFFSCSEENSQIEILAVSEKGLVAKKAMEQQLTPQEAKLILRLQKASNKVSVEEAIQITNDFAASLQKTDSIISFYKKEDPSRNDRPIVKTELELNKGLNFTHSLKIKSVSAMRSNKDMKVARGLNDISIPDTLAYIFDFNDSAGFAIVSADERIEASVLAFTTKGSYDRQTDNPGMALFLKMLDAYLINSIMEVEQQKDSLLNSIRNKLGIDDITNINSKSMVITDCSVSGICIERVGPLIEVKWGQHWPFNGGIVPSRACGIQNNIDQNYNPEGRYPTGCVATATAQIISYWRYPYLEEPFLEGMSPMPARLGWGTMIDYETKLNFFKSFNDPIAKAILDWHIKAIGKIFAKIGTNVYMSYGCDVSLAYDQDALNYLSSLGLTVSSMQNYNYNQIKASLGSGDYGRLVYTRGCDTKGCHAWVIDGYMNITISNTGIQKFVYNNWGWDGKYDGWFYENVLNPNVYNFQYDLQIATVYRKNRS